MADTSALPNVAVKQGNKLSSIKNSRQSFALPYIAQDNIGIFNSGIRWKRAEVLGQGAFGTVYLGLNLDSGELMAVKHLSLEGMSKKELSNLENEIAMLQSFRHPNIVRYIGTEIDSTNTLCIFLEYVPGGSLKTLVDKFGPLNESVVRSYTRQLLLGLEYLHRNGIAHRDIKGANCLVGNDGVVKLSDFGASKYYWRRQAVDTSGLLSQIIVSNSEPKNIRTKSAVDAPAEHVDMDLLTEVGQSNREKDTDATENSAEGSEMYKDLKGTPCWMAPEVIKEQSSVEHKAGTSGEINWRKADMWSLACTCIEMSTGRPPWSQFSNPVTVLFHLACTDTLPDYPTGDDISMEFVSFLSVCLVRDTSLRADVTSLLLHPFVTSYPVVSWASGSSSSTGMMFMMRPTTVSSTPSSAAFGVRGGTGFAPGRDLGEYGEHVGTGYGIRNHSSRFRLSSSGTTYGGSLNPSNSRGLFTPNHPAPTPGKLTASKFMDKSEGGKIDYNESFSPSPVVFPGVIDMEKTSSPLHAYDSPNRKEIFELSFSRAGVAPVNMPLDFSPTEFPPDEFLLREDLEEDDSRDFDETEGSAFTFENSPTPVILPGEDIPIENKSLAGMFRLANLTETESVLSGPDSKSSEETEILESPMMRVKPGKAKKRNSPLEHRVLSVGDEGSSSLRIPSLVISPKQSYSEAKYEKADGIVVSNSNDKKKVTMRKSVDKDGSAPVRASSIERVRRPSGKRVSAINKSLEVNFKEPISANGNEFEEQRARSIGSIKKGVVRAMANVAQRNTAESADFRMNGVSVGRESQDSLEFPYPAASTSLDNDPEAGKNHYLPRNNVISGVRSSPNRRIVQPKSAKKLAKVATSAEDLPLLDDVDDDGVRGRMDTASSMRCTGVLRGHVGAITKLIAPAKVDMALLSCGMDGSVRLWNCTTAQEALCLSQGPQITDGVSELKASKLSCMYADDLCREIWCGSVDGSICVWAGVDGRQARKFHAHGPDDSSASYANAGITCMEGLEGTGLVMQDSCLISTGGNDRLVKLWDTRMKKPSAKIFKGHTDGVSCLQWIAGDRSLVSGSKDKTVRVWDIRSGRCRAVFDKHFASITALYSFVSPTVPWNGSVARSGSSTIDSYCVSGSRDGMLSIWNLTTNTCVHSCAAHRGSVKALGGLSDRSTISNTAMYSSGNDGVVKLWDMSKRIVTAELLGKSCGVYKVASVPDRDTVVGVKSAEFGEAIFWEPGFARSNAGWVSHDIGLDLLTEDELGDDFLCCDAVTVSSSNAGLVAFAFKNGRICLCR